MNLIVVNGFLGSGKTTFIQHYIKQHFTNIRVIVNEFGEVNYDGELLADDGIEVKAITHGSIFCTCKSETFISTLVELMSRGFDTCLIESSGFADPSGMDNLIAQALCQSPFESIDVCALSLVDPLTFEKLIGAMTILKKQIMTADLILINKCDLTDDQTRSVLSYHLVDLNPKALIKNSSFGEIDDESLRFHRVYSNKIKVNGSSKDISLSEVTITTKHFTISSEVITFLNELTSTVLRLKGTVRTNEGDFRVEIAGGNVKLSPIEEANGIVTLFYSSQFVSKEHLLTITSDFIQK